MKKSSHEVEKNLDWKPDRVPIGQCRVLVTRERPPLVGNHASGAQLAASLVERQSHMHPCLQTTNVNPDTYEEGKSEPLNPRNFLPKEHV